MQDILGIISDTEKKAEKIILNAKKQAESILESSKAEILKRKKDISSELSKYEEKLIEEKKLLAQFESEKIKEKCEVNLKNLEAQAESNSDAAVSFILSLI